jgi:hypothetical protein
MLRLSTGAMVMSMTEVATDTVLCDGRGTISSDKRRVQDRAPIGIDNAGVDLGGVHSCTSTGRAALLYGPTVLNPCFCGCQNHEPGCANSSGGSMRGRSAGGAMVRRSRISMGQDSG